MSDNKFVPTAINWPTWLQITWFSHKDSKLSRQIIGLITLIILFLSYCFLNISTYNSISHFFLSFFLSSSPLDVVNYLWTFDPFLVLWQMWPVSVRSCKNFAFCFKSSNILCTLSSFSIIYYSSSFSYHIISYHIISYHIISYHIVSHHISYHIVTDQIISYHISYIISFVFLL